MMWLYGGHILSWWLSYDDYWFFEFLFYVLDFLGASGFLFVSGISTSISYNSRKMKAQTADDYTEKMLRNEYLLRAFLLLIVSLLFNVVFGWLYYSYITKENKILNIWRWYILLTITFSLFLAWPLLKTSKLFRIFFGVLIWIFNMFLIEYLMPHEGEISFNGILFYILYHKIQDNPILGDFTFFLIGTVFGDLIFENNQIDNRDERISALKRKIILPALIIAPIIITFGVLFNFPDFFSVRGSLSFNYYVLGLDIILFIVLLSFEEFEVIKTEKSYRFLFYYSYYSLSVFIFHFPLALLFYHQISLLYIGFYILVSVILAGVLMRFLYKRIEGKKSISNWKITFSVKVQINRTSQNFVRRRSNRLKSP